MLNLVREQTSPQLADGAKRLFKMPPSTLPQVSKQDGTRGAEGALWNGEPAEYDSPFLL